MSTIILLCQGYCWIDTNKEFNWVIMLIIRPSSTIFFFWFQCLWAIFSLFINIFKYPALYFACGCWYCLQICYTNRLLLILHRRWFRVTSYPCSWTKDLSAKTTKYIPKCWERSIERNSNLNFVSIIKTHLLINIVYIYGRKHMVKTLTKLKYFMPYMIKLHC